jgi:hypothetical protein
VKILNFVQNMQIVIRRFDERGAGNDML